MKPSIPLFIRNPFEQTILLTSWRVCILIDVATIASVKTAPMRTGRAPKQVSDIPDNPNARPWPQFSTAELLQLRRRLIATLATEFPGKLSGELEDVVQHAFTVLLRRPDPIDTENDGVFRYLLTAAKNAGIDRVRKSNRQAALLRAHAEAHNQPVPASPPDQAQMEQEILKIFGALCDLERLVLWENVVEGRSIRAIARDLNVHWRDVATALNSGMARIRRRIG